MEYEHNEYYGLATTPNDDYLAHYGVKGMKWGVRKAIASGNSARLGRQYRKAARKLAKLEKRAASGSKYAKRAARLGIGAAAAGGLAAGGTALVGRAANAVGQGMSTIGYGANRVLGKHLKGKVGSAIKTANTAIGRAGQAVSGTQRGINAWGNSNSIGSSLGQKAANANKTLSGISNNAIARVGAGAIGAGLGAGAAYNAYRAATTKRAARKAAEFRKEMNKAFAGTQYANGGGGSRKRRRSRG